MARNEGVNAHARVDVDRLLDEIETGRGARDTVVIPVPDRSPQSLRQIRSTVRDVIGRTVGPDDQHEVQLVCSELVGNAVVHGQPPVRLLLHEGEAEIVVAVFNGGRAAQLEVGASAAAGLRIVEHLTNGRWGTAHQRDGMWVWAALPRAV